MPQHRDPVLVPCRPRQTSLTVQRQPTTLEAAMVGDGQAGLAKGQNVSDNSYHAVPMPPEMRRISFLQFVSLYTYILSSLFGSASDRALYHQLFILYSIPYHICSAREELHWSGNRRRLYTPLAKAEAAVLLLFCIFFSFFLVCFCFVPSAVWRW